MKRVYLLLAVIGTIAPYYFLIRFLTANGFNLPLLLQLLFANDISTFFAVDFLIACIVFFVFLFRESQRLDMRKERWICLGTLCTVGLSPALPLFLFFREDKIS